MRVKLSCDNLPTGIYEDLVCGFLIEQHLAGEWELTYRHDGFIIWTPDRKRIWYTKAGTYGRVQVSTWIDDGDLTSVPRFELIHLDSGKTLTSVDQVETGHFQIKLHGNVIGRPAIEDKSLLPKPIHNTATREAGTYWVLEVVAQ